MTRPPPDHKEGGLVAFEWCHSQIQAQAMVQDFYPIPRWRFGTTHGSESDPLTMVSG